jgi:enoyl-CoA hydratase
MGDLIRYRSDPDGIATVSLERPEKRNAMTYAMLADFGLALRQAAEDESARVVILTGSGGSFCAGTDLSDLSQREAGDRGDRGAPRVESAHGWWSILACPKPVIAAVDGPAVGMGAEFTSQCDVRIATDRARFAWNFVHRGLVPDTGAGTWLLPRLIGTTAALRLLYSGDFLPAQEALEIGYVSRLVAPDALMDAAREEARRFLRGSPFSIRRIKELVYAGLERDVPAHLRAHAKALQECFQSADHREGVAAFLDRRDPRFTGR